MAKAKGTTVVSAVKFLRSQRDAALRILPASCHSYLAQTVTLSSWYPERDVLELLRAVASLIPGPRGDVLAEIGRHSAREHLEGIYQHLRGDEASSGDSLALARRTFALWSTMHDTGRLSAKIEAPGQALFELRDYGCPSPEMCGILSGYFEESIRLSGKAVAKAEKIGCVRSGEDACRWRLRWN